MLRYTFFFCYRVTRNYRQTLLLRSRILEEIIYRAKFAQCIFFSFFFSHGHQKCTANFFAEGSEVSRAISSSAQRSRRQCKYTESENTQQSFSEGSLRSRSRLFLPRARRSNEELVERGRGRCGRKGEDCCKGRSAESLMIFLITTARKKRERERETEKVERTERVAVVEGGRWCDSERERAERDCSTLPCQPRIHPNRLALLPPAFNPVVPVASRIKSIDLNFFLAREAHEPRGLNLP